MIDRQKIEWEWAERGFSCDLWVDPPGRIWADFDHDCEELAMLLAGEEEFEMNGRKYRPEVGEEFWYPPQCAQRRPSRPEVALRLQALSWVAKARMARRGSNRDSPCDTDRFRSQWRTKNEQIDCPFK